GAHQHLIFATLPRALLSLARAPRVRALTATNSVVAALASAAAKITNNAIHRDFLSDFRPACLFVRAALPVPRESVPWPSASTPHCPQ
ncbi:unnamed protein product, partial [Closterium sp. Naga37s-1]